MALEGSEGDGEMAALADEGRGGGVTVSVGAIIT